MKGLFSYEGFISQTINKIIDSICLTFLWLIFSLPLFTIGAASTALYYTIYKYFRNDEGHMWQAFWRSFKMNFKQSTIVWLFFLVFYVVFGVNIYFGYAFYASDVMPLGLLVVILVIAAMIIGWSCYIFPYIARFKDATKVVLKNCMFMLIRHFWWTILLLGIFIGSIVLLFAVPFGMAFAPVACAWVSSYVLEHIFEKYIPSESAAEGDADRIENT